MHIKQIRENRRDSIGVKNTGGSTMEHYKLQPDEVMLFEDHIFISGSKASNHLILTNFNLVVISTIKKMFKSDDVTVTSYPVTDIKIFNDAPQVKQSKDVVTVFLSSGELVFSFDTSLKAMKFVNKVIELITGKTTATRGAGKVKSALGLVDDTLGINTMGTISGVLENGIGKTLFKGLGSSRTKPANTSPATEAASALIQAATNKQPQPAEEAAATELSYEQRVESVKKLKELLDMGILSQEEFDTKKKELLQL